MKQSLMSINVNATDPSTVVKKTKNKKKHQLSWALMLHTCWETGPARCIMGNLWLFKFLISCQINAALQLCQQMRAFWQPNHVVVFVLFFPPANLKLDNFTLHKHS